MATITYTSVPQSDSVKKPLPELVNGDKLTREEFERRYRAMPGLKKAELIEGVVYMPSPVCHKVHSKPHMILGGWLAYYISKTPGLVDFGDNGTVRLDNDNEPQPDLFLMVPRKAGGQANVDEDDYISGAPELICEVTASSVSIDLHMKKNAYRRNGVREYLVWRTEDAAVDWFVLEAGDFRPLVPDANGLLRSRSFPGLAINPRELFSFDLPALFALLDRSTSTLEHAEFVKRISQPA